MKDKIYNGTGIIQDLKKYYSYSGTQYTIGLSTVILICLINLVIPRKSLDEYNDYTNKEIKIPATIVSKEIINNNHSDGGCYFRIKTDNGLVLRWSVNLKSYLKFSEGRHYNFRMTKRDFDCILRSNKVEDYFGEPLIVLVIALQVTLVILFSILFIGNIILLFTEEKEKRPTSGIETAIVVGVNILLLCIVICNIMYLS